MTVVARVHISPSVVHVLLLVLPSFVEIVFAQSPVLFLVRLRILQCYILYIVSVSTLCARLHTLSDFFFTLGIGTARCFR